jgi:hypothetical protein
MQEEGGGRRRAATHSARAGGFEVAESAQTLPLKNRPAPSWGNDHPATDESVEGEGVEQAEEHKECIIELVLTARQSDALDCAVSAEAKKRHEERCQKDATPLEELVATFQDMRLAREAITVEKLEHARQWARCSFEPWARSQREDRLARRWEEWEKAGLIRVRFRWVPATSSSVACHLLVETDISIIEEQSHPVRFEIGQRRCSTNIVTVTEVTDVPNEALRAIWARSRMVGGKRIACEESQGDGQEEPRPDTRGQESRDVVCLEDQTDNIATLLPTNDYSSDILQHWV